MSADQGTVCPGLGCSRSVEPLPAPLTGHCGAPTGVGLGSQAGLIVTVVVAVLPDSLGPSHLVCIPHAVPRSCGQVPAWRGSLDRAEAHRKAWEQLPEKQGLEVGLLFPNP